jgi:hypothetical protein
VSLTAAPISGSSFGGWGGACSGTGACQVTMSATTSVTASFQTGSAPSPPGDLNLDGRPDLLWHQPVTGSLYAWFLVNGKMTSGAYVQPDHGLTGTWEVRGLGDLDGDTKSDLLWQDQTTGALAIWLMDGTKMVRAVSIPGMAQFASSSQAVWQVRGVADINGDGNNDVIWHHRQSGAVYVWFMKGTTPTGGAALTPRRFADTNWQLRGLADFNGDGKVDLLWHNQATGDIYVWLMKGTVATGASYTTPYHFADTNWRIVRVMDINNDGKPDILWQNQTSGDLYAWYMNGLTAVSAGYLDPNRPSSPDWQTAPE